MNVQLYLLEPLHSNIKFCIHTHVKTRTRSHRYGGCPAATGNQDGASCYRSPMTLLIPSWLSLCPVPYIPPINRTACQLILPRFFSLPSIKPKAPQIYSKLPRLHPYQTHPLFRHMAFETLVLSFSHYHLYPITHQTHYPITIFSPNHNKTQTRLTLWSPEIIPINWSACPLFMTIHL